MRSFGLTSAGSAGVCVDRKRYLLLRVTPFAVQSESTATIETREIELLSDITEVLKVYSHLFVDVVFSKELIRALCEPEESIWKDYNSKKHLPDERCLQPRQLANLLKDFHLRPREQRKGADKRRGFKRKDLDAVIARYLPA